MSRFDHDSVRRTPFLRTSQDGGDDGFVLLETIVAISIITIVMTALAAFFVTTISTTSQERVRQQATQIADTATETIRGMHASDTYLGHTLAMTGSQFAAGALISQVSPWLADMTAATDTSTSLATPNLSTTGTTTVLNNVTYTTNTYLGWCFVPATGSTDCVKTSSATSDLRYLRAVVAVTWPDRHCPASTCAYVTSTLLSAALDPTFNINATPPAVPIVSNPGNQTSYAVNDSVSLQMAVQANTGVAPFTWSVTAGSLPPGVSMGPTGNITGSPSSQVTSQSVTITVTDAFVRSASATFTWSILPALVAADPGPQASVTGSLITPLTVTASGGAGAPYTWTDPSSSLPPGLSLATSNNNAVISGRPTTPGVYSVTLAVADKTGTRKDTVAFNWTVTYPPLAASIPTNQTSTVSTATTGLQLAAGGGDGNYVWSDPTSSLPAGLSISTAGLISGTPTTAKVNTVTLKVSDPTAGGSFSDTVTFTWTIAAKPTIGLPIAQTSTEGNTPVVAVAYTCPNTACTITLTNPVPGIGLSASSGASTTNNGTVSLVVAATSGTVYLNGQVAATAVTGTNTSATYTPKVQIVDASGATPATTTSTFSWQVFTPPTIATLGSRSVSETGTPTDGFAYTCPRPNCTIALNGTMVPGLGLSTSATNASTNAATSVTVSGNGTIYVNGLVGSTAVTGTATSATFAGLYLSIADTSGLTVANTISKATYTAYVVPTLSGTSSITTNAGSAGQGTYTYSCLAGCTATIASAPAGIGLTTTNNSTTDNTSSASKTLTATTGTTTATFYANGTVTPTATKTTYSTVITLTDAGGVTLTANVAWKVK
ncbi:putative Ig domain-containing protein [Jatrophihabitans telluris]|uniref:Ig domain-containing protein n=1 Tax=Jatrophihabitans telluris TaxID=2038343 RepID=A0ABY4R1F7_9ACTN|nr:putative Ig domain-containing protein [Jatrophihabitans telluris]UQX89545.1 putative Ig domain-containing protein [Jatrophihabitans telluris]